MKGAFASQNTLNYSDKLYTPIYRYHYDEAWGYFKKRVEEAREQGLMKLFTSSV